ncbi:MAG TPA: acyl-CoA desaturase [Mycobacteriales bacterium]|nr:acyl-CoA desaturase [Mycobacteriales bacterium]
MTTSHQPGGPAALAARTVPKPLTEGSRSTATRVVMGLFVVVPFLALLAAVPVAWGDGLSWTDAVIALVAYAVTGLGVSIGLHRYLTHGAFTATRWLRVTLALAGGLAVEGSPTQWVADHRRHHQFSDRDGDPHSPWRYGANVRGLAKGLVHAHIGWLFARDMTNRQRFAPDLVADRDIQRLDRMCLPLVSLAAPAVAGGLLTWSWSGALTAFFWGGLVRVALLHHVTWSINSVCHVFGERPFRSRDRATNFWPLAVLSFGESWHNAHHAEPVCARHGVLPGQWDISARIIWCFERLGWVRDVQWPNPARMAAKRMG